MSKLKLYGIYFAAFIPASLLLGLTSDLIQSQIPNGLIGYAFGLLSFVLPVYLTGQFYGRKLDAPPHAGLFWLVSLGMAATTMLALAAILVGTIILTGNDTITTQPDWGFAMSIYFGAMGFGSFILIRLIIGYAITYGYAKTRPPKRYL